MTLTSQPLPCVPVGWPSILITSPTKNPSPPSTITTPVTPPPPFTDEISIAPIWSLAAGPKVPDPPLATTFSPPPVDVAKLLPAVIISKPVIAPPLENVEYKPYSACAASIPLSL